ncbi:hypothetical protein GCM10023115_41690 [Pontixanthobacter gangjinensis]|uniref:RiboL-PSP-HEPN domain-containing protein n=1 Tax=Christiangramia aestuarii TaxID=1028746 RepID=A0A7K1LT57_9FLAO|nr:MAE_28990/MAE_18760 family HEPN-like nuclease [Christiangramia aestuarii]MUP43946.1 hypothetical protein [Christiangramia aestuarii]
MKWKLEQQEKKLDNLFDLVQNVEDEEQQAILSKFLCIRASGFVESSIRNLIAEFTDGSAPKQIQSYVGKETKYITNLRYDRLSKLLGTFDSSWKEELEEKISEEQKSALNTIVSNRNNIAHGENDAISYSLMFNYYSRIKEVVEILKNIVRK